MAHFLKAGLQVGPSILVSYFAWMRKFAKHPEKYPIEMRYKKLRKLLIRLSKSLGVEYHASGFENLPKEKYCMVSNHLSSQDPLSLICVLEDPCTFVAKKELTKTPFIGKIITGIDGLFIDREDLKQSLRVMMKVEESLKTEERKNWIIYPEGTRNKDPMKNMKMFHKGTFRPATKAGVPIVPVAIYGSFRALKGKPTFKKNPIFIEFCPPIYPEDYKDMNTQDIAELVQERISKVLDYKLRKLDHQRMIELNDKHYKFNQIL